jgi:uncharacterized membrane protein YphA (DoxX/SURF4 family)
MQTTSERNTNAGLLIMRLGIAASLLVYAIPRLLESKAAWIQVGKEMRFLQADFPSQVVGLIILIVQIVASVGLVSGYMFRLCAVILAANFSLYFFNFMSVGYKTLPLYALALAIVCLGLLFSGPGRYAVAVKIERK